MSTNTHGALTGKAALITGAARRVGATIARKLHAAGANIVLHYRSSAEPAEALAGELNEVRPNSVVLVEADLLDPSQLQALPAIATSNFGTLDILVNNASTFYPTPMGDITEIDWNDLIGTNLKAPLFLSQAASTALRISNGLIVNIADIHGTRPHRQGGGHHVDPIACAGAGTQHQGQCGCARAGHVAGRWHGQGTAGQDRRSHGVEAPWLAR
jgi:pteridine reductase